jgi:hypothetical protein
MPDIEYTIVKGRDQGQDQNFVSFAPLTTQGGRQVQRYAGLHGDNGPISSRPIGVDREPTGIRGIHDRGGGCAIGGLRPI